jgi:hypothetical protein
VAKNDAAPGEASDDTGLSAAKVGKLLFVTRIMRNFPSSSNTPHMISSYY